MKITERIRAYSEKYHMVERNDTIVVGVSGGADSVYLLYLLCQWREELNLSLKAVHVNHGLRGKAADADEEYVKKLCEEWKVDLSCKKTDIKVVAKKEHMSTEEAGRMVRYQAFEEAATGSETYKIATAHHGNDRIETLLFHLFRGTGLKGLIGIEPKRDNIIRPLLCISRAEIEKELEKLDIAYCTDASNYEEEYTRNKIRLSLIPYVEKEVNEQASKHMLQTAELISDAYEYIRREAEKGYGLSVREEEGILFLEKPFLRIDPYLQTEVLKIGLERLGKGLKDIGHIHLKEIQDLFEREVGKELHLPRGILVTKTYEGVLLGISDEKEMEQRKKQDFAIEVSEIPTSYEIEGEIWEFTLKDKKKSMKILENPYTKWFDYDKIIECLKIRTRENGDYLEINKDHGRKKIKDYFINQKVPKEERNGIYLLSDGNHILWIPGYRISEAYKVTEDTSRILEVQIRGGR